MWPSDLELLIFYFPSGPFQRILPVDFPKPCELRLIAYFAFIPMLVKVESTEIISMRRRWIFIMQSASRPSSSPNINAVQVFRNRDTEIA